MGPLARVAPSGTPFVAVWRLGDEGSEELAVDWA